MKSFEIDLKQILIELLYRAWIIIIVAAVTSIGFYTYAKTSIPPKYTASAMLYVKNYQETENMQVNRVSAGDISTAQALVQTYLQFLSSDKVLDGVSKCIDGKYSAGTLRGMISASAVEETEIFKVEVTSTSAKEAAEIANIIANMAPEVITQYIEGSSVKIVDYAKVPTSSSYPSYLGYAGTGAMSGGGATALIILCLYLFNTRITDKDDVEKMFEAPVLGKIPNFKRITNASYSSRYSYSYSKTGSGHHHSSHGGSSGHREGSEK